jgi:hypothetical protein
VRFRIHLDYSTSGYGDQVFASLSLTTEDRFGERPGSTATQVNLSGPIEIVDQITGALAVAMIQHVRKEPTP